MPRGENDSQGSCDHTGSHAASAGEATWPYDRRLKSARNEGRRVEVYDRYITQNVAGRRREWTCRPGAGWCRRGAAQEATLSAAGVTTATEDLTTGIPGFIMSALLAASEFAMREGIG